MNKRLVWLVFFSTLVLSSCVPNKKIVYLQDITLAKKDTAEFVIPREDYRLKPGDYILVDVKTSDAKAMNYFSNNAANNMAQMANINGELYFAMGYGLDKEGMIDFPYIGKLKISDKTPDEAQVFLTEELKKYLINVVVTLRWGGIRFSILGEVRNPGKYMILQNQVTILEALAQANDFTDFAKRSEVLILRETPQGLKTIKANFLDSSLMKSPAFFLQPDDVIYVQPIKARMFATVLGAQYLQILTALLTAIVLVNNLTR